LIKNATRDFIEKVKDLITVDKHWQQRIERYKSGHC